MFENFVLRVWLNAKGKEWIAKARESGRVGDVGIQVDKASALSFLEIRHPHDPLIRILPKKIARFVTLRDRESYGMLVPGKSAWGPAGRFTQEGVEVIVSQERLSDKAKGDPEHLNYIRNLSIKAPSLGSALDSYYEVAFKGGPDSQDVSETPDPG